MCVCVCVCVCVRERDDTVVFRTVRRVHKFDFWLAIKETPNDWWPVEIHFWQDLYVFLRPSSRVFCESTLAVKIKGFLLSKVQYIRLGPRDYYQRRWSVDKTRDSTLHRKKFRKVPHAEHLFLAYAVTTVRKVCNCLAVYTASKPSVLESSATPRF